MRPGSSFAPANAASPAATAAPPAASPTAPWSLTFKLNGKTVQPLSCGPTSWTPPATRDRQLPPLPSLSSELAVSEQLCQLRLAQSRLRRGSAKKKRCVPSRASLQADIRRLRSRSSSARRRRRGRFRSLAEDRRPPQRPASGPRPPSSNCLKPTLRLLRRCPAPAPTAMPAATPAAAPRDRAELTCAATTTARPAARAAAPVRRALGPARLLALARRAAA